MRGDLLGGRAARQAQPRDVLEREARRERGHQDVLLRHKVGDRAEDARVGRRVIDRDGARDAARRAAREDVEQRRLACRGGMSHVRICPPFTTNSNCRVLARVVMNVVLPAPDGPMSATISPG